MAWWKAMDWKNLPEVKRKADAAKEKAWMAFLNHFPKADKRQFVAEPRFDDKLDATAEVFFKERAWFVKKRVQFRQTMLERQNETGSRLGRRRWRRRRRISLSAGAAWFESFYSYPCDTFQRQSAKFEENIQQRNKNLRHA